MNSKICVVNFNFTSTGLLQDELVNGKWSAKYLKWIRGGNLVKMRGEKSLLIDIDIKPVKPTLRNIVS